MRKENKHIIENCLKEHEGASSVSWGEDSCTIHDSSGKPVMDFMIDESEDEVSITSVEDWRHTIAIEI